MKRKVFLEGLNDSYEKKKSKKPNPRRLPKKIKLLFKAAKEGNPKLVGYSGRFLENEINAIDL